MAVCHCNTSSCELGQPVVGVVVIHGGGRDQLVLNEYGRRNLTLIQYIEADPNQIIAITFREVGHRSHQASVWLAKFCAALWRRVLPHDDAILRASRFLESTQRAEGTGIVDGTHQDVRAPRGSQVPTNRFETRSQIPVAIEISDAAIPRGGKD